MDIDPNRAHDTDQAQSIARDAFDRAYYLSMNPDVDAAGLDAWTHYRQCGWREGRDPTDWFSTVNYLGAHPDVAIADKDPFEHYIVAGRAEGRALSSRASSTEGLIDPASGLQAVRAEFDPTFYNLSYPDIDLSPEDAFRHYLFTGWREGRDPCGWFSTRGYLEANYDVGAAGTNPFVHYVMTGRDEGRAVNHGLGFRFDLVRKAADFERALQAWPNLPVPPASDARTLATALGAGSSDRLHITLSHDDYTANLGGIQLCVRLEAGQLAARGIRHLHLFPSQPGPVVDVDRPELPVGALIDGRLLGFFALRDVSQLVNDTFANATVTMAIHSLIGFNADALCEALRRLRLRRSFYWLHDFSSLCANFTLMRNDATFCGPPSIDSTACDVCAYGARRRVQMEMHVKILDLLDPIVMAPSESALAIWRRATQPPRPRARIRPHASLKIVTERADREVESGTDFAKPVRVGFLGMPSAHKGWPVFAELARAFSADERYQFFHLAKETDPSVPAVWVPVFPTATEPAPMTLVVEQLELDVVVLWSLCQETFGFAAFEAVAGGAAVITSREAGNIRDMVIQANCGAVFGDERELHQAFDSSEVFNIVRKNRRRVYALEYANDDYFDDAEAK